MPQKSKANLSSNTTLVTAESRGWRNHPCNWDENPALLCSVSCPLTDTRSTAETRSIQQQMEVLLTDHLVALCCICFPSLIRGLCQRLQFSFNEKSDTSKHLNYSAHNYKGWYGDFITLWKDIVIAGTTSLVFRIILIWPTVKYIMSNFTRSAYELQNTRLQ